MATQRSEEIKPFIVMEVLERARAMEQERGEMTQLWLRLPRQVVAWWGRRLAMLT